MKLNKKVWHGRYYEQGTEVIYCEVSVKKDNITDRHGCANHWVSLTSNPKDILNIWECEITN